MADSCYRQGREPAFDAIIPAPVRYCEELRANAKLLYGEIRALSGPYGYCWATNGYFAELYGMNERSIARLISQLEKLKFITIKVTRDELGHVNGRRIYIGCGFPEPENDTLTHMTKKSACMTKKSVLTDQKVIQDINKNNITRKGDACAPAREKTQKDAAAREELRAWAIDRFGTDAEADLIPALMSFCDSRQARKKPLPNGRAVTALDNKLMRYSRSGNIAVMLELLDKAILHGWDSVYPLKDDEIAEITGGCANRDDGSGEEWA